MLNKHADINALVRHKLLPRLEMQSLSLSGEAVVARRKKVITLPIVRARIPLTGGPQQFRKSRAPKQSRQHTIVGKQITFLDKHPLQYRESCVRVKKSKLARVRPKYPFAGRKGNFARCSPSISP
jgi:hypothetical protein